MRKKLFILFVLVTASLFPEHPAHCRSRNGSGFRYGLEWGMQMPAVTGFDCSFITAEKYLVSEKELKYGHHINGIVSGFVGYDVIRRLNISLFAGYEGLTKGERGFGSSLRGTAHLSGNPGVSGSSVFLEGGVFWRDGHDLSETAKAGYSHRINLISFLALDINCGICLSSSHPDVYDKYSGCMVTKENLGHLRNIAVGPFLTVALVFK